MISIASMDVHGNSLGIQLSIQLKFPGNFDLSPPLVLHEPLPMLRLVLGRRTQVQEMDVSLTEVFHNLMVKGDLLAKPLPIGTDLGHKML